MSYSSLEEFQQPKFEGYGPKTSKSVGKDISNEIRESLDAPLVEELVSDDKLEKKTVFLNVAKIKFIRPKQQEKAGRKPVKYAEMYSFDHVQADCNYHQRERVVSGNNYTRVNYNYSAKKAQPNAHRNMVQRAVLMKTGLRSLNTAGLPKAVNTARPNSAVVNAVRKIWLMLLRPQHVGFGDLPNLIGLYKNKIKDYVVLWILQGTYREHVLSSYFKEFRWSEPKGGKITSKESQTVLLKVPRKNNMYIVDMKNIVPKESLSCLVGKGFLLSTKDETSGILKRFITEIENLVDKKVKIIRCDNGTEFKNRVMTTYKRGLASVEEQLVFYKKNEVIFYKQLAVLKRDISYKDSELSMLKSELEKLKQEKESNQLKIENFDNASKSLDKLIESQIPDKSRKGVGFVSYNAVLPPPIGLFLPPNLDLSYFGLKEFQQPKFEGYGPKSSKSVSEEISNEVRESPDAPLVKELADCNYHQRERVVSGNNYTRVNYNYSAKKAHLSAHRNMVPRALLMKTGLRSLNTAKPVNNAHPKTTVYSARPMSHFSKSVKSTVKRPYQIRTTLTNKNFSQKVNTTKRKFYTARPKAVNTARPNSAVVNVVRANQGHPQKEDQGYVDGGCSRHMTRNMSYLSKFKEFDGGYVTFGGGGAKGWKITGKGTLKTSKLDFENVYFVKEL
ncbi:hypothetical protein Tco_1010731 [Tanacetum coccineum]